MKNTKKFGLAFLMLLLPALLFAQSIADEIISTQKQLAKIDSQRQILLANLEDFKLQKNPFRPGKNRASSIGAR